MAEEVRLAACTVASRNYLAYARVVAESWLRHHPDSSVTVVLLDADPATVEWQHESVEIVTPTDLGIDPAEFNRMAGIYGAAELAIACKPWVMRRLLDRAEVACYFDGDIEVLAPVDDVVPHARQGVVLTPHSLHPLPADGRLPAAPTILLAGIYNAGFLAVTANEGGFLDWWAEALRRDCIHDLEHGFHGDQRWLDFVPSYFPHVVLRDPTYNVAYWNLHERPVAWSGERLVLDDDPVRFFHYSGLSPEAPWRLSQYAGPDPRTALAENSAVARLCRAWIRRLDDAGRLDDTAHPYRFGATERGLPLDTRTRRIYRDALLAHEAGKAPEPPCPFDGDGGQAFELWLTGSDDNEPISRYVRRIWSDSPFLQGKFPNLDDDGCGPQYLAWLAADRGRTASVPDALMTALDLDRHEEKTVDEEPDLFTEDDPAPIGRSAEPLPQLAAVHGILAQPPDGHTPGHRGPAKVLSGISAGIHQSRDARSDEVARQLAAAIEELRERVTILGSLLDHALRVDLPTCAVRLSMLEEAAVNEDKGRHELDQSVTALEARLRSESERVDGALETGTITGNILSDTEQRLVEELAELRSRLAALESARRLSG